MKRYDLSEETVVLLQEDGSITLEVLVGDELASVFLTATEVTRLRALLCEVQAQQGGSHERA